MNKKVNTFFLILLYLCFSMVSYAEEGPPPPSEGGPFGPGNPVAPGLQLPIDEYIPFFIGLAVLVGVVFLWNEERTKTSNP